MKKQKFISKKWFIILGVILLLIPMAVHAQDTSAVTPVSQLTGTFDEVFKSIAGILTQVMKAFQKLLWPIMLAIGGLLGNDLLFGAGMEQRLLEVWTQIRNLVNIIFVVILLGVAIYNVIGFGKSDNFMLKTALPKIVIALIAVNFSYVAMKVILDVTNVLTISIFALPSSVSEDLKGTEIVTTNNRGTANETYEVTTTAQKDLEAKICKSMFGTASDFNTRTKTLTDAQKKLLHCELSGTNLVFTESGKKFFAQYSPRNASLVMAIQLMNVVDVDKITQASAQGFDLSKLSFTLLFSVIIYLLYAIAYAVLFVVLLVRLVVLWIFIALSPVVAITLAFPDLLSKGGSDFDFKEKFIKHAIAPIMIAIPMTLGYIMLDALKHIQSGQIRNDFQLGALDVNTAGISDLQTMMVAFGAVAVVWVGVFAAARGTYAEGIVDGIRTKLKQYGGTVAKAVKLLPVIPAGAGAQGRISIRQAGQLWREPMRRLEQKYGGETERGPLTLRQVNKIRTVAEARAALGREGLEKRNVQKALAKKIANWRTKGTTEQRTFARQVAGKLEGYGSRKWRRFAGGGLRGTELRGLKELAGRTPVVTRGGTPTTTPKPGAAAAEANVDENMTYVNTNGLEVSQNVKDNYDKLQKEKAKTKPSPTKIRQYEKAIRGDTSFQNVVAVKNKASASLQGVSDSAGAVSRSNTKPNQDKLKTAIDAADKELKDEAKITDDGQRKKILRTFVEKAGAKVNDLPDDIKSKL